MTFSNFQIVKIKFLDSLLNTFFVILNGKIREKLKFFPARFDIFNSYKTFEVGFFAKINSQEN